MKKKKIRQRPVSISALVHAMSKAQRNEEISRLDIPDQFIGIVSFFFLTFISLTLIAYTNQDRKR